MRFLYSLAFILGALVITVSSVHGVTQFPDCDSMGVMNKGPDISIVSRQASYDTSESARLLIKMNNTMEMPLADGKIYVDIVKNTDGVERIFDTMQLEPLNMQSGKGETIPLSWEIPSQLPQGKYTAKAYVVVGEKHELAGTMSREPYCYIGNKFLSPSPDTTDFSIPNGTKDGIAIDSVTINQKRVMGGSTVLVNTSTVNMSLTLQGTGTATVAATASEQQLFKQTQDISGSQTFTTGFSYAGGKSIEITVSDSAGIEREMTIPLSRPTSDPKIRYAGFSHLPQAEKTNTVYLCTYMNLLGGDITSQFTGEIAYNGNVISTFDGRVVTERGFALNTSTITEDGKLSIRLRNEKGAVHDGLNLTYDQSAFTTDTLGVSLSLNKKQVSQNAAVPYTISLTDAGGNSIQKPVIVTVRDAENTLVKADKIAVAGTAENTLRASYAPGTYTLQAKEVTSDTVTQKQFNIVASNRDDPEETEQTGGTTIWWWIAGGLVAVLALLIILGMVQRRGEQNGR